MPDGPLSQSWTGGRNNWNSERYSWDGRALRKVARNLRCGWICERSDLAAIPRGSRGPFSGAINLPMGVDPSFRYEIRSKIVAGAEEERRDRWKDTGSTWGTPSGPVGKHEL
jgi:hypothetical protein